MSSSVIEPVELRNLLGRAALPPRSELTGVEPIGIGKALMESGASVLKRLAAEHGLAVGNMVLKVIAPFICRGIERPRRSDSPDVYLVRLLTHLPASINGLGQYAVMWADALARLTMRDGIRQLNFTSLVQAVPQREFLRDDLTFCPACYREWGRAAYEPLIWSVKALLICPVHGSPLHRLCPNPKCRLPVPVLAFSARPGHCPTCDWWLGDDKRRPRLPDAEKAWQPWVAGQLSRLVEGLAKSEPPTGAGIDEAVAKVIEQHFEGNLSAFARAIGRAKGGVCEWRSGRVLPTLEALLRIAAVSSSDLTALVHGRLEVSITPSPESIPMAPRRYRQIDWQAVRLALMGGAGEDSQPVALYAFLDERRLDRTAVTSRLPAECAAYRARANEVRLQERHERQAREEHEVREAVKRLAAAGVNPARWRVQQEVPSGVHMRDPALQQVWRDARLELGR